MTELENAHEEVAEYVLTPDIIRDFCKDAIRSGVVPTDAQIDALVGEYECRKENGSELCPSQA